MANNPLKVADDALDRMARAERRGTGCHLTADMIACLGVTTIGDLWSQERPDRDAALSVNDRPTSHSTNRGE